jgi:hypothetical protein
MAKWRAIWNPDLYHGHGARPPFWEGWYFNVEGSCLTVFEDQL